MLVLREGRGREGGEEGKERERERRGRKKEGGERGRKRVRMDATLTEGRGLTGNSPRLSGTTAADLEVDLTVLCVHGPRDLDVICKGLAVVKVHIGSQRQVHITTLKISYTQVVV